MLIITEFVPYIIRMSITVTLLHSIVADVLIAAIRSVIIETRINDGHFHMLGITFSFLAEIDFIRDFRRQEVGFFLIYNVISF